MGQWQCFAKRPCGPSRDRVPDHFCRLRDRRSDPFAKQRTVVPGSRTLEPIAPSGAPSPVAGATQAGSSSTARGSGASPGPPRCPTSPTRTPTQRQAPREVRPLSVTGGTLGPQQSWCIAIGFSGFPPGSRFTLFEFSNNNSNSNTRRKAPREVRPLSVTGGTLGPQQSWCIAIVILLVLVQGAKPLSPAAKAGREPSGRRAMRRRP